jgi:hypothetical protein
MLRPVESRHLSSLLEYYSCLETPPADLNASMMIAWSEALHLQFLIEDDVLYVFAKWNDVFALWGPPIGPEVGVSEVDRSLRWLRLLNGSRGRSFIMYVWEEYPLWRQLRVDPRYVVEVQGTEYMYHTDQLAELRGRSFRKKRYQRDRFRRDRAPLVVPYSLSMAESCLELLQRWAYQKHQRVPSEYLGKFNAELEVCGFALQNGLPLEGVVVFSGGRIAGFSLGAAHGSKSFNCMFEKTDLEMRGAAAFVFSSLAEYCLGRYSEINVGEDWAIPYLAKAKLQWHPSSLRHTFSVRVADRAQEASESYR